MNNESFSPDSSSGPNPLAEQWSSLDPSSTNDSSEPKAYPESNDDDASDFNQLKNLRRQLAEEQLELKNFEGELAVQKAIDAIEARQIAEDEAEQERFKVEEEARMAEAARQEEEDARIDAEIERQNAEIKAAIAERRREDEEDEISNAQYIFANVDLDFYNIQPVPDITMHNLLGLIGVYAGIKPFALDHLSLDHENPEESMRSAESTLQDIQKYLSDLGITFTYDVYPSDEYPSSVSWYASKDPRLIQEFKDLQLHRYRNISPAEQDDITRREGQLFGYPATATEYFIRHSREREEDPDTPPIDGGIGPKFSRHEYVHSPEHAEEEYQAYEAPLYAALRKYYPSYAERLDQQLSAGSSNLTE